MALIEIESGKIVYVLDTPGAPLVRCRVLDVDAYHANVERFGYGPTRISRHRVYAIEFGEGCCRTCGAPARQPYRRRNVHGEIVEGCVDAMHDALDPGHGPTERQDREWHDRPAGVRCREIAAERIARG